MKVKVVSNSLWPHGLYSPWNSLGQNTGVRSLSLLQGTFLTQRSNPGLLNCRWILYQMSPKGSPRTLEWVTYLFSKGSSRPRNQTGFFKPTAMRETPVRFLVGKIPWRREWLSTPVFWPGEFCGLKSSVRGVAKSQTRLSDFHFTSLPHERGKGRWVLFQHFSLLGLEQQSPCGDTSKILLTTHWD